MFKSNLSALSALGLKELYKLKVNFGQGHKKILLLLKLTRFVQSDCIAQWREKVALKQISQPFC